MPLGKAAMHLLNGRWVASLFIPALVLMVPGGGVFLFPVYSKAIITPLGYDEDEALRMLAVSKNVGASLGFFPITLIYEVLPPRAVLPSVAAMNLVGVLTAYVLPYLAVAGHMARPPLWLMCVFVAVGAHSQSFAVTGALAGSIRDFLPDHHGIVLSLLLAFAGLGGSILAQFGRAASGGGGGAAALLLFMACLSAGVLLLACTSIRATPLTASRSAPRHPAAAGVERRGVMRFLGVSALAAGCLLLYQVVDLAVPHVSRTAHYVTSIAILVLLVISLLVVAVMQESEEQEEQGATTLGVAINVHGEVLTNSNNNPAPPPPPCFREKIYSILRAVLTWKMLLIFVVTFAIGGGVQTPIDMMDQMGRSLRYKYGTNSKLVSLVSLLDYAGRLAGGFISDAMVARLKRPRPVALTVAFLLACFGHLFIVLDLPCGLYLASAVMGFCLGALWTVLFVTISEVSKTRHLATLYSLAGLPSAVGSYVLNVQVAGRLYSRELQRQRQQDQGFVVREAFCVGVNCFREAFVILICVTALGAVASGLLAFLFCRAPPPIAPAATTDRMYSSEEEEEEAVSSPIMKRRASAIDDDDAEIELMPPAIV